MLNEIVNVENMIWDCDDDHTEFTLKTINDLSVKIPCIYDIAYEVINTAAIYRPRNLYNLSTLLEAIIDKILCRHDSKNTNIIQIIKKRRKNSSKKETSQLIEELSSIYPKKSLQHAILWDDVQELQELFEAQPYNPQLRIPLEPLYQGSFSLLNYAAYVGSPNVFNLILQHGGVPTHETAINAICGGSFEILDKCGAIQALDEKTLSFAVIHHRAGMIEMFRKNFPNCQLSLSDAIRYLNTSLFMDIMNSKPDVNASEVRKPPPLVAAAYLYNTEMVKVLLKNNAHPNVEVLPSKRTPLLVAAKNGCWPIMSLLLDAGANIDAKDANGADVLMLALSSRVFEAVKLIVERHFAITNHLKALRFCIMIDMMDILQYLLEKGIYPLWDINDGIINYISKRNNAGAFKVIVDYWLKTTNIHNDSNFFVFTAKLGNYEALKYLIEKGWDVNKPNYKMRMAIHAAQPYPDVVELLIQHGADVNALDSHMRTPLMESIRVSSISSMIILLNHGANPNMRDEKGFLPLSYAIHLGKMESIVMLMRYNTETTNLDQRGRDAIEFIHENWPREAWKNMEELIYPPDNTA